MPMTHVQAMMYGAMVFALYGSPVMAYFLYRAWKRGHVLRTLSLCVLFVFAGGAAAYWLLFGGIWLLSLFA
ncbi:MAG TPA: hypothetical protein VGE57_01155 [Solimonas sp.]